jgi:hypothetical protein
MTCDVGTEGIKCRRIKDQCLGRYAQRVEDVDGIDAWQVKFDPSLCTLGHETTR